MVGTRRSSTSRPSAVVSNVERAAWPANHPAWRERGILITGTAEWRITRDKRVQECSRIAPVAQYLACEILIHVLISEEQPALRKNQTSGAVQPSAACAGWDKGPEINPGFCVESFDAIIPIADIQNIVSGSILGLCSYAPVCW